MYIQYSQSFITVWFLLQILFKDQECHISNINVLKNKSINITLTVFKNREITIYRSLIYRDFAGIRVRELLKPFMNMQKWILNNCWQNVWMATRPLEALTIKDSQICWARLIQRTSLKPPQLDLYIQKVRTLRRKKSWLKNHYSGK